MKLFMKIGMAFLAMLFMLSCTNTADDTINYELDNIESKNFNAKNQAVTVPFKSSFSIFLIKTSLSYISG